MLEVERSTHVGRSRRMHARPWTYDNAVLLAERRPGRVVYTIQEEKTKMTGNSSVPSQ